jgi:predicted alpha/beta hydrolase
MMGSVETSMLKPQGLRTYGALCGRALARGHARSGDAVAISDCLGASDTSDGASADFAETYADVNAGDHAAYLAAIKDGRVSMPKPTAGVAS